MPSLAVIAYPEVDRADGAWIEAIRTEHDPQAGTIAAHFTLVFPAEGIESEFTAEAAASAATTAPISFTIRGVTVVADKATGKGHVFLSPHEGTDEVASLHQGLHSGPLARLLRADRPFQPHITVAAKPNMPSCMTLAQELAFEARVIHGTIRAIEVIEVLPQRVRSVATFPLGG
jgi:2'-5' RNA ligase